MIKNYSFTLFLMLLLMQMGFSVFAAGVQKWIDADGKTHYGERPPAEAKVENVKTKISTVGGGSAATSADAVILYSTASCGYCKRARKYLAEKNIAYREFDIEKDTLAKSRYKRAGGMGVPFLVKGDNVQRGFSKSSYDRFFAN